MANLYGTTGDHRSPPLESEEMSSFVQNLLQGSSTAPPYASFKPRHNSDFSDPGGFYPVEAKERNTILYISGGADSDPVTYSGRNFHDVNDFDFGCEEPEEPEVPANTVPPRSSKRTRAAEIHNLSEKRRRSRINEKLKALQTLIPNSNKTDKASMLDEAIEYLKQLQLQVQMLTLTNGLTMNPVYLPETQLHPRGLNCDHGNGLMSANRGDTVSNVKKFSSQTPLYMPDHTPQNWPIGLPSATNINSSETSFGLEPSILSQYELNHLTSSKDICHADSASELKFDINCSGKHSSSGIS